MVKSLYAVAAAAFVLIGGFAATPAQASGDGYAHHVVFHVDEDDKDKMNLTLNNASNVEKFFEAKGEKVLVEIVAYGPGLNMLRDDTSPVKARMETYVMEFPDVKFAACGNTIAGVTKKEGKAPPIMKADTISVVPSGVVQLMMRQDEGWSYIRP